MIVEALSRVRRHPVQKQYGNGRSKIAVYRPLNLTPEQKAAVLKRAESYVGCRYGYAKIALHLLDWILLGAFVFRRLARGKRYPICSWLVAHAFKAVRKDFGVQVGQASPDDIWDFVTTHPGIYDCVRKLSRYS